jgi:hypothetical protein
MLATIQFRILSIKTYRIIIPLVVLNGCGTWSLTLREQQRLTVSENKLLRIFGTKREEQGEDGEDYTMRSFITCTHHQILLG